jgi:hypothetical protein
MDIHLVVNDFNIVLGEYNCEAITVNDIQISNRFIHNFFTSTPGHERLSAIIYDHYFPRANNGKYNHFTNLDAFENILTTRMLRLTSPLKRIKQGEYSPFYDRYKDFQFKNSQSFAEMHKQSMSDLFYLSLVPDCNLDSTSVSRNMWEDFGDNNKGVRILFDIQTSHPDFRTVNYVDKNRIPDGTDLLQALHLVCKTHGCGLTFASVSKFGAFFVPVEFREEQETRFLIKKGSDQYRFPFQVENNGDFPYIEMGFNSDFAAINIIEVEPGKCCDENRLNDILSRHGNDNLVKTMP